MANILDLYHLNLVFYYLTLEYYQVFYWVVVWGL